MSCFSVALVFNDAFMILQIQAREIQRATEAYLLYDGSQWSSTPPVKVSFL